MARIIRKPKSVNEDSLKDIECPVEIEIPDFTEMEVEAEKKEEIIQELEEPEQVQKKPVPKRKALSFGAWFQKKSLENVKLRLSYREALEAHCKAVGISDDATEEEYDAALKHFGL